MQTRFPDAPPRIARLPVSDKGFPIPYFAAEIDGKRDFRVVTPEKMAHAVRFKRCWVCGEPLGKFMAFVIGPMCSISRTISDPPSHKECAVFAALHCPFLSNPSAKRNERGLPEERSTVGNAIARNPGASAVWVTTRYRAFRPDRTKAGLLFDIGEPQEVLWFANGRTATREEVRESVRSGYHLLIDEAEKQGNAAMNELHVRTMAAERWLPAA